MEIILHMFMWVFFDFEKFAPLMSANNKGIDDSLYLNFIMYWHLCQQSRKQYVASIKISLSRVRWSVGGGCVAWRAIYLRVSSANSLVFRHQSALAAAGITLSTHFTWNLNNSVIFTLRVLGWLTCVYHYRT